MPQLDAGSGGTGSGAGGGDDLGAPDELLAFQDEGEEQDKSRDSAAGPERDLAELKSSLVNESEGAGGPGPGAGARGEADAAAEVSTVRVAALRASGKGAVSPSLGCPAPHVPPLCSLSAGARARARSTEPVRGQTYRVPGGR